MMRICLVSIFLFFLGSGIQAQKSNTTFYLFDKDWKPCQADAAYYLGCFDKLADTSYQWRYYHFTGPLLSVETYKDEETTMPHGYFAWFDVQGRIDSSGYTFLGKKNKTWLYYTDTFSVWRSEEYENGKLIRKKELEELLAERKSRDSAGQQLGEKEAVFSGGTKAWRKYLENNYEFPERAQKLNKGGTVRVYFMVDSDGLPTDFRIQKSVEYSIDEEAVRLLKKSPRWEPAVQFGKRVKAYRVQPITFSL